MLHKISNQTLYERVVDQIKNSIVQGVYRKGDMLPSEKELVQMTGVSRITVREALRLLSDSGVIETRQGKGSFVLIDSDGLQKSQYDASYCNLFLAATQVRIWLEPEVARQVALTAKDEDIAQIGSVLKEHDMEGDVLEQFHISILKSVHNEALEGVFDNLTRMERLPKVVDLVAPAEQKRVMHTLQKQHEKIYDAIREHNGEFAYFYMKEHVTYVYNIYKLHFDTFLQDGNTLDSKE